MKNKDSILYLPKNIDLIPNAVLTQGLVWLKPNILKPINSQRKGDIDIIWYDKEQYFAQSISFKEAEKELPLLTSMIDKLAKNNIIHENKAANLKANFAKHTSGLKK